MTTIEFETTQIRFDTAARSATALARQIARRIGSFRHARINRRALSQFLDWDARMLEDVGLSQADIIAEMAGTTRNGESGRVNPPANKHHTAMPISGGKPSLAAFNAPLARADSSTSAFEPSYRQE